MNQAFSLKTPRAERRFAPTLASTITFAVSLAFSGAAAAADQCTPVSGTFGLTAVPAPCGAGPSASPLCLQGAFIPYPGTAPLGGTSMSMLTGLLPSPVPHSVVFTARSTLNLPNGTVTTTDVGIGTGCEGPMGPCASSNEVLVITSGTGAYENASGTIFLSGPYMANSPGPGSYKGQICTGKPKKGGRDRD